VHPSSHLFGVDHQRSVTLDLLPVDIEAQARPIGSADATVRFDANPDTEVRIDDAIRFETAQSRTFELAPGPHRVIFRHPQLGVAERQIEVAAGEELTLRPGFESQPEAP